MLLGVPIPRPCSVIEVGSLLLGLPIPRPCSAIEVGSLLLGVPIPRPCSAWVKPEIPNVDQLIILKTFRDYLQLGPNF